MPKQNGAAGQEILRTMRIQTLLSATGDSVVESYVAIAKQEAQAAAKASGGGMAAIREAVEKAETETRAKYENGAQSDLSGIDVTGLSAAVDVYTEAVKAYAEVEAQARGEKITVKSVMAEMGQISKVPLKEGEKQYAQAHPNDVEDCSNIILTYSDGSMCNIIGTDAVVGGSANHINVACNDMKFQMNLTQNDLLKTYCCDDNGLDGVYWGELNPPKTGWNNVFVSDEVIRGYTGEMKSFLESMAYGTPTETPFELAYDIIRVVYAAFRSAEEGRRIEL